MKYEDIQKKEDIYIVWSNFRYHTKHIMYIHTTIIIDESIIRKRFYGKEDLKRKETKMQHIIIKKDNNHDTILL